MVCGPCGQEIEVGQEAIFAVEHDGRLQFGFTCCHKPVGDVAVVLGSLTCIAIWLQTHEEYRDEVMDLIASRHHHESQT